MKRKYLIVSPCRNEADLMRNTLDTVAGQSICPAKWVIVDDGSSDDTPLILKEYATRYSWITIVTRQDRGHRSVGPGVIDAFYAGLKTINIDDFDYICKLDLDLQLSLTYFETMILEMEKEPNLGNFSGKSYIRNNNGTLISERLGDENAIGASKFYRVAAYKDIGGFVREVCWDGIDGHMLRMKGWIACSEDRPELRFIHLRQMGSSQHSIWVGRMRWGFGKYFMGSAWYYVIAVAVYRMFEKPYFIGGLGIFWGYMKAMLTSRPRFENEGFRRFLRRYELQSLIFGKHKVTEQINEAARKRHSKV